MKPVYLRVYVPLGGRVYDVDCRVIPPRAAARVGADHPRYLDPGSPPRAEVVRVLLEGVDVGDELGFWSKRPILQSAERQALARFARDQRIRRLRRSARARHGRGRAA